MTGWNERTINRLPFYKVLLYLHSYAVTEGCNTEWLNAEATAVKVSDTKALDKVIDNLYE